MNSTITPATTPSIPVDGVTLTHSDGSPAPSRVTAITRTKYSTPLRKPPTSALVTGPANADTLTTPSGSHTSTNTPSGTGPDTGFTHDNSTAFAPGTTTTPDTTPMHSTTNDADEDALADGDGDALADADGDADGDADSLNEPDGDGEALGEVDADEDSDGESPPSATP